MNGRNDAVKAYKLSINGLYYYLTYLFVLLVLLFVTKLSENTFSWQKLDKTFFTDVSFE